MASDSALFSLSSIIIHIILIVCFGRAGSKGIEGALQN